MSGNMSTSASSVNTQGLGSRAAAFLSENIVTVIFIIFTLLGFVVSSDVTPDFFLSELSARLFRNGFTVLSLVIPVIAGLGLNFGIIIGAMAGQIAIVIVRYFYLGGISGLLLCFAIAGLLSVAFGYFTGVLYNKTRGQEMIASLIVGFFANGLYQFLFLFAVGVIIKVPNTHPLIKTDGVGVRMSVDLMPVKEGGLKYSLDNILKTPLTWSILVVSLILLAVIIIGYILKKNKASGSGSGGSGKTMLVMNISACLAMAAFSTHAIITDSSLNLIKVPVVTGICIVLLCVFIELIMKTKLGQDFRSVGQSQHIARISGIDVDKTRIIAVILSTVLASWGHIIYLQNMGTFSTYSAHSQIGMFSVASLLVGGASTSRANVKHAIIGTILFNSMFIMSPEIGMALFGQALLGEYFRTFMAYGVIGVALGLYVWKANRKNRLEVE